MRLMITLIAALALAACSESNGDSPHRGQSGPYIGGGVGGSM
jgi:hypothetical protein